jgi:hypothetical protein
MVVARNRAKISVTVDPALLREVDAYVAAHEGLDRSKVIDQALMAWYAEQQDAAMVAQYAAPQSPQERAEREAWRRIQTAAASRIFRRR